MAGQNESFGAKFVHFIYKVIIDGRTKTLNDKIKGDPELQTIIASLEDNHKRLVKQLAKHKKEMTDAGAYTGD